MGVTTARERVGEVMVGGEEAVKAATEEATELDFVGTSIGSADCQLPIVEEVEAASVVVVTGCEEIGST